jgi:Zn-dependent protease
VAEAAPAARICGGCGAQLAPSFLVCPGCNRLAFADELRAWAAEAEEAERTGQPDRAVALWRRALAHLPPEAAQHAQIGKRIDGLTSSGAAPGKRRGGIAAGGAGVAALLLSKLKLLALGFTKLGTLLSMLATFGVYWTLWGWPFAAGLVLCIYVHEIGHVAALRRLGIAATAPMFIPGLGAFVRLKQSPATVREDARVGLAGPVWGLATAIVCALLGQVLQGELLRALAKTGAWINLFNLLPLGSLDGGRAFRALSRPFRLTALAALALAWWISRDGILLLLMAGAGYRCFGRDTPTEGDRGALATYVVLVVSLAALLSPR